MLVKSPLTPNQIRQAYLQFFEAEGHRVIPSASLVPENDPTTLFTSSGMQPLVPYLLGQKHPMGRRLVDSQKSFRSQDIDEVGDNRHTTFFEMLGNWSLGDYFKEEQLRWFFTFITQKVGLDPEKLFVTVFAGNRELGIPRDSESVAIWKTLFKEVGIEAKDIDTSEKVGLRGGRIFYYGEKKNWWSRSGVPANMPAGEPGGPDSEMFYDFGEELQLHENSEFKNEPCHVNCDCGRFMEIGNSVFMQYQKQADGSFKELPQKNVDFGGGLERISAAVIDDRDVFKTELFWPIIQKLEEKSGQFYEGEAQREMRIIADHLKAATMLIVDGVEPSNKTQGYVLRRLLRRAGLKAHQLNKELVNELPGLSRTILELYQDVHAYYSDDVFNTVELVIRRELLKFEKTLDKGLKVLEKTKKVDGKVAFDLYQSYGFPLELTTELLQQKGQKLDIETFQQEFQKHKELSRTASAGSFKGGLADHSAQTTRYHTATHLLHAALRKIVGQHVQQKGSNITVERLRFDFSQPVALTSEQIKQVEDQINEWIGQDLPVTKQIMEKQAALNSGAIAFFIEKYPDEVSVYTIGKDPENDWISKEFCGGPHVTHTGEIGKVKIVKEQAVSSGVRRIYIQTFNN